MTNNRTDIEKKLSGVESRFYPLAPPELPFSTRSPVVSALMQKSEIQIKKRGSGSVSQQDLRGAYNNEKKRMELLIVSSKIMLSWNFW